MAQDQYAERCFTGMRILFGHQSVGQNIIDGLEEEAANVGTIVPIEDIERTRLPSVAALIAHFRVGVNGAPLSKLGHFERAVRSRMDDRLDLALFKFCYVDIVDENTAEDLFSLYRKTLDTLQADVAPTRIAHVTVPLRAPRRGFPAVLQRWRDREDPELARNRARHRFNEYLRDRYAGTDLLFDLAASESDESIGQRRAGTTPTLRWNFTTDGGHLNAAGRAAVAADFVRFLDKARARFRTLGCTESLRAQIVEQGARA